MVYTKTTNFADEIVLFADVPKNQPILVVEGGGTG
jgi:hypothetical protein